MANVERDLVTRDPFVWRDLDDAGQERHWIFEIHFVDRGRQIGGFYEELLTLD